MRHVELEARANLFLRAPEAILETDVLVSVRRIPYFGNRRLAGAAWRHRRRRVDPAARKLVRKTLDLALCRRCGPLRDPRDGSQLGDGLENGTLFGVHQRRDLLEELHQERFEADQPLEPLAHRRDHFCQRSIGAIAGRGVAIQMVDERGVEAELLLKCRAEQPPDKACKPAAHARAERGSPSRENVPLTVEPGQLRGVAR